MTKEEEEQRASAALYALKRRYRTSQELERNLRDAYSALVDCEEELAITVGIDHFFGKKE